MTARFSAIALLIGSVLASLATAHAQSRAVESLHFEADFESTDSDSSGSTSNGTLGLNLRSTIPLGSLFGTSLSAGYSETRIRTRRVVENEDGTLPGVRPSCNFDNLNGELGVFARRPTLGRIAVSYGVGRLSADCSQPSFFLPSGDDSMSTDHYTVAAELYWRNFTLGASRTTVSLEDAPEIETTTVTGSWYPLDSLRVSVFGNDLYDEDTYGIELEHQPQFLGDGFGIHLSYANTDSEPRTRTVSLGLTYYFGRRVPLLVRDRQYR
ncbi:MAG: hypothetical protein C0P74_006270 [Gammaproteobacteria bacterium]|nr:hypothetical protein [Gammaproteobacteria bacterium]